MSVAAPVLTPSRAAHRLTHVLNAVSDAHGVPRFPIDVDGLAREAHRLFGWDDAITDVQAAKISGFEGALFPDETHERWLLLYNDGIRSPGRIRFTQAHELGHYLLHRMTHGAFQCTEDSVMGATGTAAIETEADSFAAQLLMPLDDFRVHVPGAADFDMLVDCAERYGVSLTAATLRWIDYTQASAVLIVHRDGYMRWAKSSAAALKAGAYFATRKQVIEVPASPIATRADAGNVMSGTEVPARLWFPHAPRDASVIEMKVVADTYDWIMTLLVLPRHLSVWPTRNAE